MPTATIIAVVVATAAESIRTVRARSARGIGRRCFPFDIKVLQGRYAGTSAMTPLRRLPALQFNIGDL
jgi:hypothetical protein